jgi:hypothetical protein
MSTTQYPSLTRLTRFHKVYNYIILFSDDGYYCYNTRSNEIIGPPGHQDIGVPINSAISDIASNSAGGSNSIRVIPERETTGFTADQSYLPLQTPIDFSPLWNNSIQGSFLFDSRGTKMEAMASMNMMVNLSNLSNGVLGNEGTGQMLDSSFWFGGLYGNIPSGTKKATYGIYVRDVSETEIHADGVFGTVSHGVFFDSGSAITGHDPAFGTFSNKVYVGQVGSCGGDGVNIQGDPAQGVDYVLGNQSNEFDFGLLIDNVGNQITVGATGGDNSNLNDITVRAAGGVHGIVDNSGSNYWRLPGGLATSNDTITFPASCLPNFVDLLLQNTGNGLSGLGLPHIVRALIGTETGPPVYRSVDANKATFSGNGVNKVFTINHICWTTPSNVQVTPASAAAEIAFAVTAITSSQITVTFASAPASGTNNVVLHYRAEV